MTIRAEAHFLIGTTQRAEEEERRQAAIEDRSPNQASQMPSTHIVERLSTILY